MNFCLLSIYAFATRLLITIVTHVVAIHVKKVIIAPKNLQLVNNLFSKIVGSVTKRLPVLSSYQKWYKE